MAQKNSQKYFQKEIQKMFSLAYISNFTIFSGKGGKNS